MLITDSNVFPLFKDYLRTNYPHLAVLPAVILPAGDKSLSSLSAVWKAMSDNNLKRTDTVYALGGGTVTDIAGLAAATFKRGLRCVYLPTTLLAMADAAIGGKTGIDFNGFKNEIGTFTMPAETVIDTHFLSTLPDMELLSGFAEMLKTGLVAAPELFHELLRIAAQAEDEGVSRLRELLSETLIRETGAVKRRIVESDPMEKGLRRILNFGHTAGHAYEALARKKGCPLPHGVAVAYGMVTAVILSCEGTSLSPSFHSLIRVIKSLYPRFPFNCGDHQELLNLMLHDKKNANTSDASSPTVTFVLIDEPGNPCIELLPPSAIRPALEITQDLLA